MTYNKLNELVSAGLSVRDISKSENTSFTNVRYWLKKHGLATKYKAFGKGYGSRNVRYPVDFLCKCGETDPKQFYQKTKATCIKCWNLRAASQAKEKKQRAIDLLGGACNRCGYTGPICAFDFHHIDRASKDPFFRHFKYWSWKRMLKEIVKCELLCAICHRIEHSNTTV